MIKYRDLTSDTICAPVTAPGHSGVSVIRISGPRALEVIKMFTNLSSKKIETHKSWLTPVTSLEDQVIDQALVTYFEKGKSFTGDETVEISCHGNPLIVNNIIELFLNQGCRSAERGEFSFRAYYNGKIDLVQAESIHQLVTSSTTGASGIFLKHLEGKFSDRFHGIESELINVLSHLEASIDFVEEDIETSEYGFIQNSLDSTKKKVAQLVASYSLGKSLSRGFKILILGPTNVGKSSLFNALVESERAIVTEVAGTTRDLVSEKTFLDNTAVEFIDSAGLRETEDQVEQIGIQKSLAQMQESDLVLHVVDGSDSKNWDWNKIRQVPDKSIIVVNKLDLFEDSGPIFEKVSEKLKEIEGLNEGQIAFVSALKKQGLDELKRKIREKMVSNLPVEEQMVVTQARHFNHLSILLSHLDQALTMVSAEDSPDLISQELRLGLMEVHQLLGKEYDDEILDKIFSDFCIGK